MVTLGAILLNPPLTRGTRTVNSLCIAADILECDTVEVANLFSVPTRDVTVINSIGRSTAGWEAARTQLLQVVSESDHLLAGWGVSGLSGLASTRRLMQIEYVYSCARKTGKNAIWTLNGEARHPSRWHQYVSDRHGRARGNSLRDRIGSVLTQIPVPPESVQDIHP